VILESNLSTYVTPEMWISAFEWANRNNKRDEQAQVILEEPKTLQQGCSTSLVAALGPSIESTIKHAKLHEKLLMIPESTGGLLADCVLRPIGKDHAEGKENIDKLWTLSEKLVGQKFDL
jgi:hypothetical protein